MTPDERTRALAFNAVAPALPADRFLLLSERQAIADAVLAAVAPEIRRQVAEQIAGAIERDPRITRQPRRLAASVARLHVVANPQLPEPLPAIQGLPEPAYFCAPEDGTDDH